MNDDYDTDVDDMLSGIGSLGSEEMKEFENEQERNPEKHNNFEDDFLNNSIDEEEDDEYSKGPNKAKGISNKTYFQGTIKGTFDSTIKKVSEKLLKSTVKEEEMDQFKQLLAGFDNWFLANDTNWVREDHDERYDQGMLSKTTFEFVVYDKETNAFTLPFSDVYINVVIKKKGYRPKALRYVSDYLRSQSPDSYIQEFLTEERKNRRKIIFRFLTGKTKFVFMVNIELHLRFHQILKQYSVVDERFLLMGTFLSFWAHSRGLWKDNYLNPQTLYLMIVYFLMVQNPPVLPNIYDKSIGDVIERTKKGPLGSRFPLIIKIDKNYETDIHKIKAKISDEKKNELKIGELVTRFFYMYAYDIPTIKRTVSIKKGRLIEPRRRNINGYSVEDPFIEGYDTCRILNNSGSEAYKTVKREFERAYELISGEQVAGHSIKDLCNKFNG